MTSAGADKPTGSPCHPAPIRLKVRKEFVAASRGARRHASCFTLQIRPRGDAPAANGPAPDGSATHGSGPARFGLTVTKKTVPLSVHRNRIRRRMREALRLGAALSAAPGHDYVFVAREIALAAPFDQLKTEMSAALAAPIRERRPKNRPPHT
jgi:ribonuclease P protein component